MFIPLWAIAVIAVFIFFLVFIIHGKNCEIVENMRIHGLERDNFISEKRSLEKERNRLENKANNIERQNAQQLIKLNNQEHEISSKSWDIERLEADVSYLQSAIQEYQRKENERNEMLSKVFQSNLEAFPYIAGIMADYSTAELFKMEQQLDWGNSIERRKKVQSIRTIRLETKEAIEKAKEAEYQLEYLLKLYPELEDIIESDYKDLDISVKTTMPEHDPARDYMTKEEWQSLDEVSRNQLALDRYVASRKKTKWQIGRDYEYYVGYTYEKQENATVEYTGSRMRLEDLGRDLIVHSAGKTRIIQCKYWSQGKQIHEKHVLQLYGTVILYCNEHNLNIADDSVKGVLVTNTTISNTAKEIADILGIMYKENYPIGDYPRIKCNIGKEKKRIYHLPMDLQYDNVVIDKEGEFFAFTVKEAVDKGFRRAYKWFGADR